MKFANTLQIMNQNQYYANLLVGLFLHNLSNPRVLGKQRPGKQTTDEKTKVLCVLKCSLFY